MLTTSMSAFAVAAALGLSTLLQFIACPAHAAQAQAVVPIVAYNPTYRLIVGGAYFSFPEDSRGEGGSFGLQALSTLKGHVKLIPEYKLIWGKLRLELAGKWSNFYDPYYGEGDNTGPIEVELDEESHMASAGLFWQITKAWSTGPIYDFRVRLNRGVNGDPNRSLVENERSQGYGWRLTMDYRDSAFSAKKGTYLALQYFTVPESMTTTKQDFRLVTGDLRQFFSAWRFTLGLRATGGFGSTSSSYLYRYRLGGSDLLRGYYSNRFRGSNFALGQAEIRFELAKPLSLVAFTDVGNVGDPVIRGVKQTYGGGVRFGLPPDWVKKARLDIAFGKDQSGVSFVFDETF